MRPRPRPRSALPRASRRAVAGPEGAEGASQPCSRARSPPPPGNPFFPSGVACPPASGRRGPGGVEPVALRGLRRGCSAGKLTCAGAPPLGAGCLPFQPDVEGRRAPDRSAGTRLSATQGASGSFDAPMLRGGFSWAPRNFSYPESRREGSPATAASLSLLVDVASRPRPPARPAPRQMNLCPPLLPNPGAWASPSRPLLLGAREGMKSSGPQRGPGAIGGVVGSGIKCLLQILSALHLCEPPY